MIQLPLTSPVSFRPCAFVSRFQNHCPCFNSDTKPCPLPTQGPLHRMFLSPVKELSHIQFFLNFGKLPLTQPGLCLLTFSYILPSRHLAPPEPADTSTWVYICTRTPTHYSHLSTYSASIHSVSTVLTPPLVLYVFLELTMTPARASLTIIPTFTRRSN